MAFNNIKSSDIRAEITALVEDRFIVEEEEFLESISEEIIPPSSSDRLIISLKRNWKNNEGKRVLLVIVLNSQNEIKNSLQWAAAIKDELTEPLNGDLYLFMAVLDPTMSLEQCTDIESNDRICRRYVLRPNENLSEFLGRSFITSAMGNEKTAGIEDPLHIALEKTAKKHSWFTDKEQQVWRKALLSGKSSSEIIDALFKL